MAEVKATAVAAVAVVAVVVAAMAVVAAAAVVTPPAGIALVAAPPTGIAVAAVVIPAGGSSCGTTTHISRALRSSSSSPGVGACCSVEHARVAGQRRGHTHIPPSLSRFGLTQFGCVAL